MTESHRKRKRSIVIDTNILMTNLDQLHSIERKTDIYVPLVVIEELNYLQAKEDLRDKAQAALDYVKQRSSNRDPRIGRCVLQSIEEAVDSVKELKGSKVSNDDKVLYWALLLQREFQVAVSCFTQDVILQIKAMACGMNACGDSASLLSEQEALEPALEPAAIQSTGSEQCSTFDLIVDENFLVHRLSLLKTFINQSNSAGGHQTKFRICIPWKVMMTLDLLKVSNESVETKIKAARAAHFLLDHIRKRSPWIHIQDIETSPKQWLKQFSHNRVFILSEDLKLKFIANIRVINEEKLLLLWFAETFVQNACHVLPAMSTSTKPWFRQLRTSSSRYTSKKKRKKVTGDLRPSNMTRKHRTKVWDHLFPRSKPERKTRDRGDQFNMMLCDVYVRMKEFSAR